MRHRTIVPVRLRRLAAAIAIIVSFAAAPAFACDVAPSTTANVGTFSPAAIKASAPNVQVSSGFSCTGFTILTLLSANYLKATIASGADLKLTSTSSLTDIVTYRVFANPMTELRPGTATYFVNGALVNLLNLLGNGTINAPLYFRLASAASVAPGTYAGSFDIKWEWNFCNGIAALGLCIGVTDSGSSTATISVVLIVQSMPPTIQVSLGPVSWDPVNGGQKPKAIPGSKRRLILTITNPDSVATEANALAIMMPTPSHMTIALDGDGVSTGPAIQSTDGSPPSGLAFSYAGPASGADDVDFSGDGGVSWTATPVAGDPVSQSGATAIRLRPRGAMASQSSYTVTIPYSVN